MSSRIISDETKQKISDAHIQRLSDRESDEYLDVVDNISRAAAKSKGIETDPVSPMRYSEYVDDHRQVIDGDYWIDDGY